MSVQLDPHQIKAVKELHNGAVLAGGVGVGKSITAVAYFYTEVCGGGDVLKTVPRGGEEGVGGTQSDHSARGDGPQSEIGDGARASKRGYEKLGRVGDDVPTRPRDLYIITTAKKRNSLDWEKECAAFRLSKERGASVGAIQVTVDSWNNIMNYQDVKDAFFIFDEQRLVGSGAWVQAFNKIAARNQWIMLSATPGDTWMDFIPVFVANGFYKNRTDFLRTHVVFNRFSKFPKVDRYIEEARLLKYKKQILVEMPLLRHTKRHINNVLVQYDKDLMEIITKKRWDIYEKEPLKDVAALFRVSRKLVNSDLSRMGAILKLMESHPRLIVFYNFDYELEILRTIGNVTSTPVAEYNGHKHQEIPDGDRWVYLVQYTAGAEGWNCISTNAIAFYSLNYSWKINEQCRGRIDRINTPYIDLHYYILRSGSWIDLAIIRSLALKKNFNERDFGRKWTIRDNPEPTS